ncbi:hypothetical protein PS723_05183 [Pseudomonas fluorescens]|uniref:Uncharacterized protein n=1 Tax=Pseudomonas fluorescens TaxID=294 RepID=A0A5E7F3D4_PSEFL|nr:hypothetical protein PS723_05183 [Pseudomonas fluorescens]
MQNLWRGSLLPLGREAALKPASRFCHAYRMCRLYDCFARARTGRREQAPSPQLISFNQAL